MFHNKTLPNWQEEGEEAKMAETKLESIKLFFWNPTTRKCMGRTGDSWLKIIAFYIALYSILAAVWSLFFYIFQQTINDRSPKWTLDSSLIGSNPGLGFRPQNPPDRIGSALISFKEGEDGDYQHWVKDLDNYFQAYNATNASFKENCNRERDMDSYCPFNTSIFPAECSSAQNYSFPVGKPCVLIKINRIYGWIPVPYDTKPQNFPTNAIFTPNQIPITCDGQNDIDKQNIGELAYYPSYVDTNYYPFYNQPGYQSPFIMVHFKNLTRNTLINVECKAWAKNIEYDRLNRRGSTYFELYISRK